MKSFCLQKTCMARNLSDAMIDYKDDYTCT